METALTAIEVTGTVDEHHILNLDSALPITGPKRVRVIVLYPLEDALNETEWNKAATRNEAFKFLHDEAEDIYTVSDGKPIVYEA